MNHRIGEFSSVSPPAAPEFTDKNKTCIIFGVVLGLTFGFGPMFFSVVGVFLKDMAASFGWGRADIALLPMLAMLGTALGAPVAGYWADRIGWGKIIGFSIFFFSASLLALALAPANQAYVVIVGFLIGCTGAATTAAGYLAVLPSVFRARLGMALGFGMVGTGIGGYAAPIMANHLTNITDWRHSYAIFALLALVLGFLAHRTIFLNMAGRQQRRIRRVAVEHGNVALRETLSNYRFWLLCAILFVVQACVLGGFVHLPAYASDIGLGKEVAAQSAGLVGVGLAVSRVGVGVILDKVFAPLIGLIAFSLGAVAFAVLSTEAMQSSVFVLLSALCLGIATGTEGDIIPYVARKYFGERAFGTIYGMLFGCATLGAAIGPFVYGLAFEQIKSYGPIHMVSGLICVVSGVAIMFLGKYPGRTQS